MSRPISISDNDVLIVVDVEQSEGRMKDSAGANPDEFAPPRASGDPIEPGVLNLTGSRLRGNERA